MKKLILIKLLLINSLIFIAILLYSSCSKDKEDENPENTVSGYMFTKGIIDYETPNIINASFKVSNNTPEIIPSFLSSDFFIKENSQVNSDVISLTNGGNLNLVHKTIFLIDVSLSNALNLYDIQFSMKEYIKTLGNKEQMAIFSYSGEVNELQDFTNNKDVLNQSVLLIQPGINSRNLYTGLDITLDKFSILFDEAIEAGSVILICSGPDNVGIKTFEDILAKRGNKKIHGLVIAPDSTSNELKDVEELSNGKYYKLGNITELTSKLIEIQDIIDSEIKSFYELKYASNLTGDTLNTIIISLNNNPNTTAEAHAEYMFNSKDLYINGEFSDQRDGKIYSTVKLGNQTWFSQNLAYETSGSWYYNDDEIQFGAFGLLYTWQSAQTACPEGWRPATDNDWKKLEGLADSEFSYTDTEWDNSGYRGSDAGKQLKSNTGWLSSGNGNNKFDLGIMPGGVRINEGQYLNNGYSAYFWTADSKNDNTAWTRQFDHNSFQVLRNPDDKNYGYSVRCVKN
ncbi:MAG: hypothetical protein K8S16_19375 [Bacteroidales bacterium]|nr:hypothetical protein [Bacteroidales bacterium]